MASATISPALPDMQKAFQHIENSEMLVKLVMTIPGLAIAFSAPLVGLLIDRWKKTHIIFIATLIYGVSGIAGYFFDHSLYAILISRALLGIAVAAIMVGCTTLISDYFNGAERGKYIGLQAAFGGFGGVLFLSLGGYLADFGWTIPFLIYASAFILLPGMMFFLNEPENRHTHNVLSQDQQQAVQTKNSKTLLYSCYIMATVEVFALYMVPLHYPFYIQEITELNSSITSSTQTGLSIAIMLLMMALVSSFYNFFQKMASYPLLHAIGLALLALGYALLSQVETQTQAILALCISGTGLGLMRPNLVIWLLTIIQPQHRGKILGTLTSFFFIGQFIAPVVTQPLIESMGYASTFEWISIFLLMISFMYFVTWRIQLYKNQPEKVVTES